MNECAYCVGHHGAALVDLGVTPETVDGILDDALPGLDKRERLVRDYARLVTERAWGIPDRVFLDLKSHFSDQQIVELTIRIGLCILFNKLNQALLLDIEDSVRSEIADKDLHVREEPRSV